jgi:hypothetical protein
MDREIDLLPWILAGCLAIGGTAIAAVALSAPEGSSDAPSSAAVPAAATAPAALAPAPSSRPPAGGAAPAPAVSAAPRDQLPPGQVWECDVDGQRVFSDTKCGAHASVRQLHGLNVMDASTAPQPAPYPYPGAYGGGTAYPPSYNAPQDDEAAADYSGDVYVGERVIAAHDHPHRDHRPHSSHPHPRPHN